MNKKEILYYCFWSDNQGINLLDELLDFEKTKDVKKIIFNCANEYMILPPGCKFSNTEDGYKQLEKIIEERKIELYFIVGTDGKPQSYYNINREFSIKGAKYIWWPTYFIHHTYKNLNDNEQIFAELNNIESANPNSILIDKLYISLNNKPHYHRRLLMDYLCKYDLLDYGNISWHVADMENIPFLMGPVTDEKVDEDTACWKPKTLFLDDYHYLNNEKNQYSSIPKEFKTSLINVVTESHYQVNILTEKTVTAILLNKPFIVCGGQNFHKMLESFGFKNYDEIFDYSFDSKSNIEDRIKGIAENLVRLKESNYTEIRKKIEPTIVYNKSNALDIIKKKKYVPEFIIKSLSDGEENLKSVFHKLITI